MFDNDGENDESHGNKLDATAMVSEDDLPDRQLPDYSESPPKHQLMKLLLLPMTKSKSLLPSKPSPTKKKLTLSIAFAHI